jgi:hypothetical protein
MRIAAFTLLLGSLCLAACDDSHNDVTVVPGTRTGSFILQTVNGRELPTLVLDTLGPPLVVQVTSGVMEIGTDNTFTEVVGFRVALGDVAPTLSETNTVTRTLICSGTFTVAGDTLTFVELGTSNCGRTFTGVVGDRRLVTSLRGHPAVYSR